MRLLNLLTSTADPAAIGPMTAAERAAGRFMRSPDGHGEGGAGGGEGAADAGASAAAATDTGAAAASEGGGDGDTGASGDDPTVLGGTGEGEGTSQAGDERGEDKGEGGTDEGASGPPESYALTAPDGFEAIDTDVLAEAEPTLRELNLSNDQAQKLMPIAGQLVKKTIERAEQAITDRAIANRKEWAQAFEADPEIGGANKDATIAAAARAFDHYGLKQGEGLRQLLDESGLGNHPDLIRFVARVGRDLEEGSFERGGAASQPKSPEQKLYGDEFQPKG